MRHDATVPDDDVLPTAGTYPLTDDDGGQGGAATVRPRAPRRVVR
jgi:hypothetical protein